MKPSTEPRVATAARVSLAPDAARSLLPRQLAWAVMATAATLSVGSTSFGSNHPDVLLGLVTGLGVWAAFPRQVLRGALSALGIVLATLLAGLPADTTTTIQVLLEEGATVWSRTGVAGIQVLAAGGAAGLALCWLDRRPLDSWRVGNTALATTAAAGLGWWVGERLIPGSWNATVAEALKATAMALILGQGLLVAALRYHSSARIPSPARIKATLTSPHQEECLRAWQLDRDLATQAPDSETRDGLGEVAAWIYRLRWTLQRLDGEIGSIDEISLAERIANLYEEADATDDTLTRDRKMATARHLEKLLEHRKVLLTERRRTQALADYATAFLEEARTSLVLAHVQPGDQTPARLDDVLDRLRSYSQERDVHRRTRHEVVALG